MKCLRCKTEMKHYEFNYDLEIKGAPHKTPPFPKIKQAPHNPHSVYICGNCGRVEFSTKYCENPDV